MLRSRKLKDREAIEALDGESCDIFYPSWVDSYYPNRPDELKHMHLYMISWPGTIGSKKSQANLSNIIHSWVAF